MRQSVSMNELKPLILKNIKKVYYLQVGQNTAVGIATCYGLDVPGIEPRWGARLLAPVQTGPWAQPASRTKDTGSLPRG